MSDLLDDLLPEEKPGINPENEFKLKKRKLYLKGMAKRYIWLLGILLVNHGFWYFITSEINFDSFIHFAYTFCLPLIYCVLIGFWVIDYEKKDVNYSEKAKIEHIVVYFVTILWGIFFFIIESLFLNNNIGKVLPDLLNVSHGSVSFFIYFLIIEIYLLVKFHKYIDEKTIDSYLKKKEKKMKTKI